MDRDLSFNDFLRSVIKPIAHRTTPLFAVRENNWRSFNHRFPPIDLFWPHHSCQRAHLRARSTNQIDFALKAIRAIQTFHNSFRALLHICILHTEPQHHSLTSFSFALLMMWTQPSWCKMMSWVQYNYASDLNRCHRKVILKTLLSPEYSMFSTSRIKLASLCDIWSNLVQRRLVIYITKSSQKVTQTRTQ